METLLLAIALSCSTNLDNLAVGVTYSTKSQSISVSGNLIIALLSGLGTWVSMSLGNWVDHLFPTSYIHWFSSGLLIMIGAFSLWEQYQSHWQTSLITPENVSGSAINHLPLQDSVGLGFGLAISNLGMGIGAGMAHLPVGLVSSLSLISSILMVAGGTWLGKLILGSDSNNLLGWVTGIALILLGSYEAIA